tara:strand:- start:2669 stop:3580 length:912 start_codon:yes stop_codon:yes gene_type:complete
VTSRVSKERGWSRDVAVWSGIALLVACVVAVALPASTEAQSRPGDLESLLTRAGAQLEEHYQRAQRIVSTEKVWVRSFHRNMRSNGSPRHMEFEHRVEWDAAGAGLPPTVTVFRDLLQVDGRSPTADDRDACLMPVEVDQDPLAMLLPYRQKEFSFRLVGDERVDDRQTTRVAYEPLEQGDPKITWEDDCVSLELPGHSAGELWIDPETGDVVRLDEHLMGRFEFREPPERARDIPARLTLERSELSIRYNRVRFEDPPETLMLPEAVESSWTLVGPSFVPRYVRRQEFSDHRRFVGDGRIVR